MRERIDGRKCMVGMNNAPLSSYIGLGYIYLQWV
jgi:hypothetical protein